MVFPNGLTSHSQMKVNTDDSLNHLLCHRMVSLNLSGVFLFIPGAVAFISYASIGSIINENFVSEENLITKEKLHHFYLNSKVVSGTLGSRKNASLSTSVNFTFQHEQVCVNQVTLLHAWGLCS